MGAVGFEHSIPWCLTDKDGGFGEVPDIEMLKQVEEHLLEHLEQHVS